MKSERKTVLVIGGEGYIGAVLCSFLIRKDYVVHSFDNLTYRNRQSAISLSACGTDYRFIYGDICDKETLIKSCAGVDVVVLLSGLVGDPITKRYPQEAKLVNERGVRNVIDTVVDVGVSRLVFISTCSNYGIMEPGELANEDYPTNPQSTYASAKIANELHLMAASKNSATIPTVLRFATAFGLSPRMRFDLTVSEFVAQLYVGNRLLVYDAHTWRPYCHVYDFARLIETVIKAPSEKIAFEIFNAGGDKNNYTKQMIVELILERIPDGKIDYKLEGVDPRNYRVDFSKVRESLDFEPINSVGDGVDELISVLEQSLFPTPLLKSLENGNYELPY